MNVDGWTTLDAYDRSMSDHELAVLEIIKDSRTKPAVTVRCGWRKHTLATAYPLGSMQRLDLRPGINRLSLGSWAIWLRRGRVPIEIARIQGWPVPSGAPKRWETPEALRLIEPATSSNGRDERSWWLFCSCADVGDLPAFVLWQAASRWRLADAAGKRNAEEVLFRAGPIVER